MPTLVRDPQPVEFERLLERRRASGRICWTRWEVVYVMNPTSSEEHADVAQQLA
jgi:hypothetical protein